MPDLKKWYSFVEGSFYNGPEPAFFDVDDKDWKKKLESKAEIFMAELRQLIETNNKNIIPYFNQTLADRASNWTIFPLYLWGKKLTENCAYCPETTKIIESLGAMTSCSFSILKPHSKIKPHHGDSNVMYRCHLTLKNEGVLPEIGMRVKDKKIGWEKNKLFAFCDAHEHEVWNNTENERWVLIIDILREEFGSEKKKICAEVNATLFWQLKFQKFYFIKHLPRFLRFFVLKCTAVFT